MGTDPVINLLNGWGAQSDAFPLNLDDLSGERLSQVAFMYGGVSDGEDALSKSRVFTNHLN